MKKRLITVFYFCLFTIVSIAQPANDNCSTAIPLTLATSEATAVPIGGTTINATASTTPTAVCSGSWFGDDVWYSVTIGASIPVNGITIQVLTNQANAMSPLGMAIYTDCNAATTPISCFSTCNGSDSMYLPFVQANQTYYIRMWSGCSANANAGTFSIIAFESYVPANTIINNVLWGDISGQGDFAAGLNGWTSNAITTGDHWIWDADASANGAFKTTTISSPTAFNGAALFDADFMTTSINPNPSSPYPQHTGELISPIIDCSNFGALSCKFYQSYDALNGNTYFSYSTDGGTTWTTPIDLNDDILGNASTPVPSIKKIYMPGAGGSSQVRVKFTADMDFYNWIIDDVQLVEKESYNLSITDFYAIAPTYSMPKNQIDTIRFLADIANLGIANQTNVTLNVLVVRDSDGSPVFSTSQNFGTLLSDDTLQNQLLSSVFVPSSTIESYTATYTVTSDFSDYTPSDNSVSFNFEVVDDFFAKEPALMTNITPSGSNSWTYGLQYFVQNGIEITNCSDTINRYLTGVDLGVSNPSELIGEYVAVFIEKPAFGNVFDANNNGLIESNERQIVAFGTHTFTGNEPPNQIFNIPVTSFTSGGLYSLEDNTSYAVMMNFVPSNFTTTLRLMVNRSLDYSAADFAANLSGVERYSELIDVGNSGVYLTAGFVGSPVPAIRMKITETANFVNSTITTLDETICQGASYTVGSQSFNQTGTHRVTLTGVNNCDSIVDLNLTVLIPIVNNLTQTICYNSTYTVGTQTFTQSGNYSVTLTAANNCDSIVNLDLTVLPILSTTLTETICQGESYTVGTQTFNQTGNYTILVSSYNGCDSTVTLNLTTISSAASSITINESICEGQVYNLLGVDYSITGTYQDTTVTVAGCDSIITLNLIVNSLGLTLITDTICANTTYDFNGSTLTTSGTYQAVLTNIGNCDSTVTLNLLVNDEIQLSDSTVIPVIGTTNGSIDIVILGGTMPYQFLWNTGAITQNINNLPLGIYEVTVTDALGCQAVFTFDMSVNTNSVIQDPLSIHYYPNPIRNNELLNIKINSEIAMALNYTITDILGRKIVHGITNVNSGNNTYLLEIPQRQGTYFINFYNENRLVKVLPILVE